MIATTRYLVKVSGRVTDNNGINIAFATTGLFLSQNGDLHNKPKKELVELDASGRFTFSFLEFRKRKYQVVISKDGYSDIASGEFEIENQLKDLGSPFELQPVPNV